MTFEGAIIDLDGTVYRGGTALPGATRAIDRLHDRGIEVLFVSNNPTKPPDGYASDLASVGIDAGPGSVLTAGVVTREYLAESHAEDRIFLVGEDGLREQLAGFALVDDPTAADVVVVSIDRAFTYDRLREAARAFRAGDPAFVGTDPDRLIPVSEDEFAPGSGAIIGAVAATVGRDPDPMLGKPSAETARAVTDRLDADPTDCVVVGDRLDTDIALGERAGMTTVLVRSGVTDEATLEASAVTPDHVLDHLGQIDRVIG